MNGWTHKPSAEARLRDLCEGSETIACCKRTSAVSLSSARASSGTAESSEERKIQTDNCIHTHLKPAGCGAVHEAKDENFLSSSRIAAVSGCLKNRKYLPDIET
ncbi:hypothetical protein SCHPADRAFT_896676 [Schizopora paradoxa]|uniref:Uncharacterized protein n=1 Tax=Schizopora paradoxa TaxID=27342 RepID=A0A0H2R656_9AGAM|nr:hypothetical protein SCHPADRAFT_896676 [Schizopora paradoxa]